MQSDTFKVLLNQKRSLSASWDADNDLVFDPKKTEIIKSFDNVPFEEKIIYLRAFIDSMARVGDEDAVAVKDMLPWQLWEVVGCWWYWCVTRKLRLRKNWFAKQRALEFGKFVGAKEEFMKLVGDTDVEVGGIPDDNELENMFRAGKVWNTNLY